jgi:hypothetical protein
LTCSCAACLQGPKPLWQALLDMALAQGYDALLDCGALLAGVSNR